MRFAARGALVLACATATLAVAGTATAHAPSPARLLVTATEFRLTLSRVDLARGPAIVQLSNRGEDAHDLVLRRLDRDGHELPLQRRFATTASGALTERDFTLTPGRYVLYCSLPGHRKLGMQAHLRVR